MRRIAIAIAGLAVLGLADGATISLPAGASLTVPDGSQYRLIFITSAKTDATSSSIAYYNAFVTSAANAVPELNALGAQWRALASTSAISAISKVGVSNDPVLQSHGRTRRQ